MDALPNLSTVLPTIALGLGAYLFHRFTIRIAPGIPYAGEGSWSERLQIPVEYGKDPVGTLAKMRKKLGDVFCVDLFIMRIVFLLGAEGNKEVLRAPEEELSFWEQIRWAMGPRLGFTIDYPGWLKSSMKTVKTGLVKQERLDNYYKVSVPVVQEYFEKWSKEDSVPLFNSFSQLMVAISLTILVGDDFRRKYGDELIPIMTRYERDLQHPLLRILPFRLWGLCAAGKRTFEAQDRFEEVILAEMRERLANPEKYVDRPDYFNYVLENYGDSFSPCYGQHIISLVFAGRANAGMTTPWMYLHARRTPGAIEHWRKEVLAQFDEDGMMKNLTYEQGSIRRPYLEASLRETARLYTNTLMMRMTKQPTKVAGHTIPAWTLVACSPLALQRDETLYPDATTWNPDRFLKDGAYASWFQRGEFIHFGMGQHACPGERLAKTVILDIVVSTWMRKYEMDVVGGLREGEVGVGGVGAEAAWTEDNFGTPSIRGEDVRVRVKVREA